MGNTLKHFGTMIDCSRNAVMSVDGIKRWIDITSDLGYNTLMLYTEDTYEVNGQPRFGYMRGRYTKDELRDIDAYAARNGTELIPCIQTLAHLNQIFRWDEYRAVNDCDDILLAEDERTYKLIDDMFLTLSETFSSRTVNIGMDEAHMLGRGKYLDIHGNCDRFEILRRHLYKVSEIASKYGFSLLMWGDMFFRLAGSNYTDTAEPSEEIAEMIPDNVKLIYWDYYSVQKENYLKRIENHRKIKNDIWFAGGLWSWTGFAPHNSYSVRATNAGLSACREKNVENIFLTLWGDNGSECSKFSLLPSLFYASELVKGNTDINGIKQKFENKYGIPFDGFMLLDLPGTANDRDPEVDIKNADKNMLYNDCFMGTLDLTVRDDDGERFGAAAEKLKAYTDNTDFGYLFEAMSALCELLSLKCTVGRLTRKAYSDRDTAELKRLLSVYGEILSSLDKFYRAYRRQWFKDNKPQGFEVQDIRLGGLYFRIRHCKERLEAFLSGEIKSIDELNEEILPTVLGGTEYNGRACCSNIWAEIVSASSI